MTHDVFISHSSKDKLTADAICHALEQNGVRCWIAPRDVKAGANYGAEIIQGIRKSQLLLLIFSSSSNISSAVHKEVETAFRNSKIIIPYRFEKTKISDDLDFYIAGNHWLDAYPRDTTFSDLVINIKKLLGMSIEKVKEEKKEKKGFLDWFNRKKKDTSPTDASTNQQVVEQPAKNYFTEQSVPTSTQPRTPEPIPQTSIQTDPKPITTTTVGESVQTGKNVTNPDRPIRIPKKQEPIQPGNFLDPIQPKGKAEIIFFDKSRYVVPANYIYIRSYNDCFSGIGKNYNGNFPIVPFHDIKQYQVISQAKKDSVEYKSALELMDGTIKSMPCFKNESNIVFPNTNETIVKPIDSLAYIDFEWDADFIFETQDVKILKKNGETYCVPYPLLWFGTRTKPDPEARSWTSGLDWSNNIILKDHQIINTSQLKSIRFINIRMGAEFKNSKDWIDKCEVDLEFRDGSMVSTEIIMDSLHIWTVNAPGTFEILVQDINCIEFGDIPESSTSSALPPVDRIPEPTIKIEDSNKIVISDSDQAISFETSDQPVISTFSGVPADATIFVPKGIVTIKMADETVYHALANSVMFYRGNMKESYIETTGNEKLPVTYFDTAVYSIEEDSTEGTMHVIDEDGDEYESIALNSYYSLHFIELSTLEHQKLELRQPFTLKFDWTKHPIINLNYVLVEKDKGMPVVVPSIGFGFDYLSGGLGGGRGNTMPIPNFEGLTVPSKKISSLEIKSKESLEGWYQWGFSIDVVKKNGEIISAYTSGNIHVFMLTANGVEYLHLQELKRIVYLIGNIPELSTSSVLHPGNRILKPTIKDSNEIIISDSDQTVQFETSGQPVISTFSDTPTDATIFVPKGIVIIKTSDGTVYHAIANSVMFYRGNMKESYIETTDNEKLSVIHFDTAIYSIEKDSTEGTLHVIDEDGDEYKSALFKSYHRLHFVELPTLEHQHIVLNQPVTLKFDWGKHPMVNLKYVLVEKEKGVPVVVPSIGFGFDYLSGGFGVSRNTVPIPNFEGGLTMPSKKIHSLEIKNKESLGGWYQWGFSIDVMKKNGEIISAYTSGNIHVFMLTANGVEYLHLQELKRIVYLD